MKIPGFVFRFTVFTWSACSCWLTLHGKTKAPPLEHKDYTLFMGANFQIEKDHKLYPVVDVIGDSFVIKVNGNGVLVPVDRGEFKLKADEALKITPDEVAVRDLTTERAYTPARDPRKKFLRESMAAAELQDTQNETRRAAGAQKDYDATSKNPYATPGMIADARENLTRANLSADQAQSNARNSAYGGGNAAGDMQDELAKELFDAVEIEFKVSSQKPLPKPYVIVVAHYRNPDDRPNEMRNWIFAKQLNPIGEHERREHFLQGGLPPGFTLLSSEFHLYNEGKEIATEASHKRVALTREETFEYSMIEYIAEHKNEKEKVPPIPAMEMATFPSDFVDHLNEDEARGTFYVKVGSDGRVREVYRDEDCKVKVDDTYLAAALKSIWFEPAVEKGKPVDGVAKIRPNRIHYVIEPKV